ncbi:MAG: DUF1292 domain-containing protein [Bacillota bacterium]|nr:DUF1292 domain-containing protein [Bacillota bacterium]
MKMDGIGEEVVLVDEEGGEHRFLFADAVDVKGVWYAVLIPLEEAWQGEGEQKGDAEAEETALIFRFDTDAEGSEVLVWIDDDQELQRVMEALNQREARPADDRTPET